MKKIENYYFYFLKKLKILFFKKIENYYLKNIIFFENIIF